MDGSTTKQARSAATILIASPYPVVRIGLQKVLASDGMFRVIETTRECEILPKAREVEAGLAVLDPSLPGLELGPSVRDLRELPWHPEVLVLSWRKDEELILEALDAGVCGYVLLEEPPEAIRDAIQSARRGQVWLSRPVAQKMVGPALAGWRRNGRKADGGLEALTDRECEVLRLLAGGLTNPQIADALCIQPKTVENYVSNVFAKLHLTTRAAVIAYALCGGAVDPRSVYEGLVGNGEGAPSVAPAAAVLQPWVHGRTNGR